MFIPFGSTVSVDGRLHAAPDGAIWFAAAKNYDDPGVVYALQTDVKRIPVDARGMLWRDQFTWVDCYGSWLLVSENAIDGNQVSLVAFKLELDRPQGRVL